MNIFTAFFFGQMSTCDLESKQSSPQFCFLLFHLSNWIFPPDFVPKINGRRHFYTSSPLLVSFLSWWLKTRLPTISFGRCQYLPLLPDLSFFFTFFHSRHILPRIFLFFLNVIVKCSSEMILNMCTLTEGIHLVIYFLLPVSCFFVNSFVFRLFGFKHRFTFCLNKTIHKQQKHAKLA